MSLFETIRLCPANPNKKQDALHKSSACWLTLKRPMTERWEPGRTTTRCPQLRAAEKPRILQLPSKMAHTQNLTFVASFPTPATKSRFASDLLQTNTYKKWQWRWTIGRTIMRLRGRKANRNVRYVLRPFHLREDVSTLLLQWATRRQPYRSRSLYQRGTTSVGLRYENRNRF